MHVTQLSRNRRDKNLTYRYYILVDPFIRAIVPNYPTVAKSTATISSFGWQPSCCILSCCILGGNVFERLTIRKWKMYLAVFSSLCVSFCCSLHGLSMAISSSLQVMAYIYMSWPPPGFSCAKPTWAHPARHY